MTAQYKYGVSYREGRGGGYIAGIGINPVMPFHRAGYITVAVATAIHLVEVDGVDPIADAGGCPPRRRRGRHRSGQGGRLVDEEGGVTHSREGGGEAQRVRGLVGGGGDGLGVGAAGQVPVIGIERLIELPFIGSSAHSSTPVLQSPL